MTKEEFCKRFVAHMLKCAGPKFDDGSSIEEYAIETAPTYFTDLNPLFEDETPESLADSDMSYWGD